MTQDPKKQSKTDPARPDAVHGDDTTLSAVNAALERVSLIEQFEHKVAEMDRAWKEEKETLKQDAEKWREEAERLSSRLSDSRALAERTAAEREAHWTRKHKALAQEQERRHAEYEKKYKALLSELKERISAMEKNSVQKESKLIELHENMVNEFRERDTALREREKEVSYRASMLATKASEFEADIRRRQTELERSRQKPGANAAPGQGS